MSPVKAARHGNVAIILVAALCCLFAVGLAAAAELPDPVSAAERVDKLGAMGVLAFGFLLSIAALIYLIKLQYGRMLQVIDANTEAVTAVKEAIDKCSK